MEDSLMESMLWLRDYSRIKETVYVNPDQVVSIHNGTGWFISHDATVSSAPDELRTLPVVPHEGIFKVTLDNDTRPVVIHTGYKRQAS